MNLYYELLRELALKILDFVCLFVFVSLGTEVWVFIFRKVTSLLKKQDSQAGYEQEATVFWSLPSF